MPHPSFGAASLKGILLCALGVAISCLVGAVILLAAGVGWALLTRAFASVAILEVAQRLLYGSLYVLMLCGLAWLLSVVPAMAGGAVNALLLWGLIQRGLSHIHRAGVMSGIAIGLLSGSVLPLVMTANAFVWPRAIPQGLLEWGIVSAYIVTCGLVGCWHSRRMLRYLRANPG